MNATQEFEKLTEEIEQLKKDAWDDKTMARSLVAIGQQLKELPTQGDIWDKARKYLVDHAADMGERMERMSSAKFAKAARLEQQGIRPI